MDTRKLDTLLEICGEDHIDAALDCAIEAAKCGLRAEDILPRVRAHAFLDLAGILPHETQGFRDWSVKSGVLSEEHWAQADEIDLLGLNSER